MIFKGLTGMIYSFKGAILCKRKLAIILKLGSLSNINFNKKHQYLQEDG
jgi:hypothetical protein